MIILNGNFIESFSYYSDFHGKNILFKVSGKVKAVVEQAYKEKRHYVDCARRRFDYVI